MIRRRRRTVVAATPVRHGTLVLWLVLTLAATSGGAQSASDGALDPRTPIRHYVHDVWTKADGLLSNTIHDLVQDRDGLLWLATDRGLARFDGARFKTLDRRNTPTLGSAFLVKLHEDRRGTLWIGSRGGGLESQDPDDLFVACRTTKQEGLGMGLAICRSIIEAHEGRIWAENRPGGGARFLFKLPPEDRSTASEDR